MKHSIYIIIIKRPHSLVHFLGPLPGPFAFYERTDYHVSDGECGPVRDTKVWIDRQPKISYRSDDIRWKKNPLIIIRPSISSVSGGDDWSVFPRLSPKLWYSHFRREHSVRNELSFSDSSSIFFNRGRKNGYLLIEVNGVPNGSSPSPTPSRSRDAHIYVFTSMHLPIILHFSSETHAQNRTRSHDWSINTALQRILQRFET